MPMFPSSSQSSLPSVTRRAFTLIELLIVVAVILVLVAILIPTIMNARQQSFKAICASNIRGQAMAFSGYANNSLGQCPFPNWDSLDGAYHAPGWLYQAPMDMTLVPVAKNVERGAFWPYLQNYKAYRCPADVPPLPPYPHGKAQAFTSYIMNGAIVGYGNNMPWARYTVFKPDVILIWEMDENALDGNSFGDGATRPSTGATRRHGAGLTVGLASGAAEWITRVYYNQEGNAHPGREWANPFSPDGQ
jgi:prepilin-type N-terminal cleavage/methylation domain-containing protein